MLKSAPVSWGTTDMTVSLFSPQPDSYANSMVEWLGHSPVFDGLGPDSLSAFARCSEVRSYAALEEVLVEGTTPECMYIVLSGRFIVLLPGDRLARYGDSAMVSLDSYVSGDSFGEQALIEGGSPAVASVVATEPSEVLAIDRVSFDHIVGSESRIAQVVFRNLFDIQTRRLAAISS